MTMMEEAAMESETRTLEVTTSKTTIFIAACCFVSWLVLRG